MNTSDTPYQQQSGPGFSLDDLLFSLDESIAIVDRDLRFAAFNPAAADAFRELHGNELVVGGYLLDLVRPADVGALRHLFAQVLSGQTREIQRSHRLENGRERVYRNLMRPFLRQGAIEGVLVHSRDITGQVAAETALRESNERFRRAANASYDMIWEHDLRTGRISLSDQYCIQLGYTETEIDAASFSQYILHPDESADLRKKVNAFLKSERTNLFYPIHRLRKSNGEYIYVEAQAIVSRNGHGKPYLLTGVTRDVTQQYLMERKLRESHRRYELAAHASTDLVFEADFQTGKLIHNHIITSVYGFAAGELSVAGKANRLIHPDDRALYEAATRQALDKGQAHVHVPVLRLLKKNGEIVYTEIKALLVLNAQGQLIKRIGSARDITWRHALEQSLEESRKRFERAAEASFDMIWEADLRTGVIHSSDRFHTHMGYGRDEIRVGEDFFSTLVHPDDAEIMRQANETFYHSQESFTTFPVHRMRKKDGTYIYAEARVRMTRDEQGAPILLTGVTRDVTEQLLKELELKTLNRQLKIQADELRHSIDRYDLVAKATSDVVWDWNLVTNENWFNENFQHLFGYPPEAARDIHAWEDRLHPEEREAVIANVQKAIREGRPNWEGRYRFRRADNSWAYILDRGYTLHDESGKPLRMIGSMQDITHLRQLEEEMLQKQLRYQRHITEVTIRSQEQERSMLGRELHDNINQILASCKLMTEMALREERMREQLLERTYNQLAMAIDEIRNLSHSLVPPALSEIGLEGALAELADKETLAGGAGCSLELEGDPATVDDGLALMLFRIAQESVHNSQKYAQASSIHIRLAVGNEDVQLEVCDDGIGFDPAQRKDGIGLRNIRSRVQLHNGEMDLETAPGTGCTLRVSIPLKVRAES
ncbi:PAS domain-containing protein [Flaviaesturariibacter aridisoli]|uniref:Oxygen sensor histidine kinase NreB n=1 Tax=Flaviaesturariibacter aridisoli TaxID=2545761 RepID=A0A4V2WMQ1_9BACT|nr:PAS domain-containing protein [Flaviaesturariibacter aridisoli]TCZ71807.1 PAS domain S-box protein [Flaviaesturariibacter aridisoli]